MHLESLLHSSLTIGSPFLTMPEDFDFERGVQIVDGNSDRAWLEQRDTTFIDEYNLDRANNTGTPQILCKGMRIL